MERKRQAQQKVFMLQEDNSNEHHHAMDYFYEVDKAYADRLESEGKAVKYDGSAELDQYGRDISKAVERFRTQYDKLKSSNDPRYKDQAFFDEAVGKLKKELSETVEPLQSDYTEIIGDIRNEAQRERANLTRNITPADERGASQLMNELVNVAKLNGLDQAIERIENDVRYFTEGRKSAIANELHRLVDVLGEDDRQSKKKLRVLSNKLRDDEGGVELAARMASAMSETTGSAYMRVKQTHPAYKRR